MVGKPKVLMIATLDTKELEAKFIRQCLEEHGLEVHHLDASIRRSIDGGAAITPDQVAAAVPPKGKPVEQLTLAERFNESFDRERSGDIIVSAGDQKTDSPADLSAAVKAAKDAGRKSVLLLVKHGERRIFIPVDLDTDKG